MTPASSTPSVLRRLLRLKNADPVIACMKCGLPQDRWSSEECSKAGGHFWIDDPRAVAPQYVKRLLG